MRPGSTTPAEDAAAAEPAATSVGPWATEVWRRRWLVVVVVLLTVAAALVAQRLSPASYEASSQVRVSSGEINEGVQSSAEAATLLATQVAVLQSNQMAADVAQRLGDQGPLESVEVEGVPESHVATITVRARTAQLAAEGANTYALAYQERRDRGVVQEATNRAERLQAVVDETAAQLDVVQRDLDAEVARVNLEQARITVARDNAARAGITLGPEDVVLPNTSALSALQARYNELAGQLSELRTQLRQYELAAEAGDGGVAIVSTAEPPARPTATGPAQLAVLAFLLGIGLGVGLALLLAARDRRLHDGAAVRRALPDVVLLGSTRGVAAGSRDAVVVDGTTIPSPYGAAADDYRLVAGGLLGRTGITPSTVVVVAAPRARDDGTAAAGGLAVALASLGKRVVLVEAHRGTDTAGAASGAAPRPGLADVLRGEAQPQDVLVPVDVRGPGELRVMLAGAADSRHVVRHLPALLDVVRALAHEADVVVVHAGPVLEAGEAVLVAADADGVVVPVVLGSTEAPDVVEAVARLRSVRADVLGVVLAERPVRGGRKARASRQAPVPAATFPGRGEDGPAAGQDDPTWDEVVADAARR